MTGGRTTRTGALAAAALALATAVSGCATASERAGAPASATALATVATTPAQRSAARFVTVEAFASAHVQPRRVTVWLPAGYDDAPDARYAVLYMHDGQNLFDPATSYGGVPWRVDAHVQDLMDRGAIRPTIVVGVWNTPLRTPEYFPNVLDRMAPEIAAVAGERTPLSDGYVKFLTEELKPWVDRQFRTRPDRANTFVAGSSMGGLISTYALTERPDVFGGMAAISIHSPLITNGDLLRAKDPRVDQVAAAFVDYLKDELPAPGTHRLYFDHGTINLDSIYAPYQARIDAAVRARGYRDGEDLKTLVFEGADHNERSWDARLDVPLTFLLAEPKR